MFRYLNVWYSDPHCSFCFCICREKENRPESKIPSSPLSSLADLPKLSSSLQASLGDLPPLTSAIRTSPVKLAALKKVPSIDKSTAPKLSITGLLFRAIKIREITGGQWVTRSCIQRPIFDQEQIKF